MSHDASIVLTGELAYNSAEKLREAAKDVTFKGDIDVEHAEVHEFEEDTHPTPDGEATIEPHVMIFFWIDVSNGIDYSDKHNAAGLETDLSHKMMKQFPTAFVSQFDWNCDLARVHFCNHPESERIETEGAPDACDKCDGPRVEG